MKKLNDKSGFTYFFAMSFAIILMLISGGIQFGTSVHANLAQRQASMEEAFISAEAGLEAAIQSIVNQGFVMSPSSGSMSTAGLGISGLTVTYNEVCEYVYSIEANAEVNGISRKVSVRSVSPPGYELFARANTDNRGIWDKPLEEFHGLMYWGTADKPAIRIEGMGATQTPIYWDEAYAASSSVDWWKDEFKDNPHTFQAGLELNTIKTDPNRDVNWSYLRGKSLESNGLLVTGEAEIRMNGSSFTLKNNGTTTTYNFSDVDIIYVEREYTTTTRRGRTRTRLTEYGSVDFPDHGNGHVLDGQLTIVAEDDITINDHLIYSEDPTLFSTSDDVLGLIAKDDIWIDDDAPNNLTLSAALLASGVGTDGSFGVLDYDEGSPRGKINLLGSLVQDVRGAVGQFNTHTGIDLHGYSKNYMIDPRFGTADASGCRFSPPYYPAILTDVVISGWSESPGN